MAELLADPCVADAKPTLPNTSDNPAIAAIMTFKRRSGEPDKGMTTSALRARPSAARPVSPGSHSSPRRMTREAVSVTEAAQRRDDNAC
jgi:hypothetical protein